jgi:4-hydroxybenzoyl-CoA thioesterase
MNGLGVAYWDVPDDYGIHFPIVSMNADFGRPVEVGDVLITSIDPDVGDKSLGVEFTATDAEGNVRFSAREQHVCVSILENGPQSIPDEVRQALTGGSA